MEASGNISALTGFMLPPNCYSAKRMSKPVKTLFHRSARRAVFVTGISMTGITLASDATPARWRLDDQIPSITATIVTCSSLMAFRH